MRKHQKNKACTGPDYSSGGLRILLVSESFPREDDRGSWALLRALRGLGHDLTFVAREFLDRADAASRLRHLGISTYSEDAEKLLVMGRSATSNQDWTFDQVLSGNKFDIAFLGDGFDRGISIPEQYLDPIRTQSPGSRIAIWTTGLRPVSDPPGQLDASALETYEQNQDWLRRQEEGFARADLVLVTDQNGQLSELANGELRALGACSAKNLSGVIAQLLNASPQVVHSSPFSILQVESAFSQRLSSSSGLKRVLGHLEGYATLANLLLKENKFVEAREQLRHIFGRMDGSWNAPEFITQVIVLLRRCYRGLGESGLAELYCKAARDFAMSQWAGTPLAPLKRKSRDAPLISLIVPTFNRLPILRKCLAALEAQTVSRSDFEVIVIDDGSSDGSEEFLRDYRPSFQFRYLRQQNSGTGAARRNGVSHAAGDYLLLMNDDTICDPDVVEQHLKVQRELGSQRWAVLGSFQYPTEARLRALTHYFCVEPFMFPQVSMEEGCPYGYSHFITCNLSVRRDAVMEVGSFSSIYKLSEDTEMGLRLFERGFRVVYHPAAHAWHDHLPYPARNLIRRARVYGADYFHMFRHHPRVMKEWAMPVPLTGMDRENAVRILEYVETNRREVEQAVKALEKWDEVDYALLLENHRETARMVLNLFQQAVPAIHWFYLYETMFQTMVRELNLGQLMPVQPGMLSAGFAIGT
jgi:GT2 family glycosyltransferase